MCFLWVVCLRLVTLGLFSRWFVVVWVWVWFWSLVGLGCWGIGVAFAVCGFWMVLVGVSFGCFAFCCLFGVWMGLLVLCFVCWGGVLKFCFGFYWWGLSWVLLGWLLFGCLLLVVCLGGWWFTVISFCFVVITRVVWLVGLLCCFSVVVWIVWVLCLFVWFIVRLCCFVVGCY